MTDHRYSGASPHGVTKISFPLYQRYPLLGAFVKRPGLAAMFGYFALIAAASSLQWSWLPQWLQLWTPLLDIMRKIFPVFDNMDQLLSAKGFGHRGAVVNHLFMAGWLYTVPRLIISTAAVVSVSRKEWIRWASSIPVRSCLFFTWPQQFSLLHHLGRLSLDIGYRTSGLCLHFIALTSPYS
jgi:hypothetical protein